MLQYARVTLPECIGGKVYVMENGRRRAHTAHTKKDLAVRQGLYDGEIAHLYFCLGSSRRTVKPKVT